MVVTFKGKSEYDSKYKWNDSIKSSSFEPPDEMVALEAGKPSYLTYNLNEPALQHKKRIPDPYVTQHLLHSTNPRELQELVQDSPRKLEQAPHRGHRRTKKFIESEAAGRRTVLPASDEELSKTYQVAKAQRRPPASKPPKPSSTFSPPKAARLEKGHTLVEYPHGNPEPFNPPGEVVVKEKEQKMGKAENLKTYVVKKPPATAAAAPVAMTSAGAPRVRARTTEYQHKYPGWEGVPQSKPTLNTREMVFKSHSGIPPYMTDYIRRSSEYQKEFKDWSSAIAKTNQHARPKRIRDDMDIGLQSKERELNDDMRFMRSSYKEIMPPQVPQFPMRRHRSEYMANFKDASKYDYRNGAWIGAQHPEMFPMGASDEDENKKTTWMNEVGDLRDKAAYYGARHLGTHISKEHVGQLVSRGANKWDDPGSPESTTSAQQHVLSDALDLARSTSRSKSRTMQRDVSSERAAGLPSKIPHWDFDPSRSGVIPATATVVTSKEKREKSHVAKIPNSVSPSPRSPPPVLKSKGDVIAKVAEVEQVIDLEQEDQRNADVSESHKIQTKSCGVVEKPDLANRFEGVLSPKSTENSSPYEVRDAAGIRTSLELGRVPTPELKTSVIKSRNVYQPVSRHHLDRTTVINKPDSARSDRSDAATKQRKAKRPNSARPPIISSMEEHRLYDNKPPLSKTESISKPKSSSKAAKPVYPVPKVDSWMVRSPRNAGNTQYSLTPAKSFGKPTEDTHQLLLSNTDPAPSHSATLIERHVDPKLMMSDKKMSKRQSSAKQDKESKFAYGYEPYSSYEANNIGESLRLPLEFAKQQDTDVDILDKLSVASRASSRSLASETLERARNRRDFLRQK